MPVIRIPGAKPRTRTSQCQQPSGWLGKVVLWTMNRRHSRLTDWGLAQVTIPYNANILDVGCGGGRTVQKLAAVAAEGMVHGIDYAPASVAAASRLNRRGIEEGRVGVQQASVTALPFADATFDLVTAIETHFWWDDLSAGVREVLRVLKPGGRVLVIAEFYNGGKHARHAELISRWTRMAVLDVPQHEAMLTSVGFMDVQVIEEPERGWICALGTKPR